MAVTLTHSEGLAELAERLMVTCLKLARRPGNAPDRPRLVRSRDVIVDELCERLGTPQGVAVRELAEHVAAGRAGALRSASSVLGVEAAHLVLRLARANERLYDVCDEKARLAAQADPSARAMHQNMARDVQECKLRAVLRAELNVLWGQKPSGESVKNYG